MKALLITQRWESGHAERDAELRECADRNRAVFGDGYIAIGYQSRRVSFGDLFAKCGAGLNIVCNSDIVVSSHTRSVMEGYYEKGGRERVCMALSRYDVIGNAIKHHAHRDSQDTFVICGRPSRGLITAAYSVPMGIPGSDNRLCAIFVDHGYRVVNPSKTVRTYHHHESGYRTYGKGRGAAKTEVVPGPYFLPPPCELSEV